MLDSLAFVTVNRTEALVLGFFLVVWVSLLLIFVAAPEVFDQALRLPTDHRVVELAVLAGLSGLIGFLARAPTDLSAISQGATVEPTTASPTAMLHAPSDLSRHWVERPWSTSTVTACSRSDSP